MILAQAAAPQDAAARRAKIRYRPAAGRHMQVAGATVCYRGSEADWADDCETWKRMSRTKWPMESSWAVLAVDLTLTTWAEASG